MELGARLLGDMRTSDVGAPQPPARPLTCVSLGQGREAALGAFGTRLKASHARQEHATSNDPKEAWAVNPRGWSTRPAETDCLWLVLQADQTQRLCKLTHHAIDAIPFAVTGTACSHTRALDAIPVAEACVW